MKKAFHIGLILLLVGLGLFINGYKGAGGDLSAINGSLGTFTLNVGDGEKADNNSETFSADALRRVVIDEGNAAVRVGLSPDKQIHVTWQDREGETLSVRSSGGTLTLKRNVPHFGVNLAIVGVPLTTEVLLPASLVVDLELSSDNGGITLDALALEGDVSLSSDNGDIRLDGVTLGDLRVDNDNGTITLSGSCGKVTLEGDNGSVYIEDLLCRSLEIETDNGGVHLSRVTAETTLSAELNAGSITLESVAAGQSLSFRSDLGSIHGTLAGSLDDYSIEAETDLGTCNLPAKSSKGDIRLEVSTDLGSIDVSFAGD